MVQNRDLLSTRTYSSTNWNESIVRKMFVNLRDFGPIEEPDMKYLKERQKKIWVGGAATLTAQRSSPVKPRLGHAVST